MPRVIFNPSDYNGNSGNAISGILGAVASLFLVMIANLICSFYFANIDIKVIPDYSYYIDIISIILGFIEIYVYNYYKDKKRNLAEYSESSFDSSTGCWFFIALIFCSFYLNCIIVNELNGRLDLLTGIKRTATVNGSRSEQSQKNKLNNIIHYFVYINDETNTNEKISEIGVSGSMAHILRPGDKIEFETKPGLLGLTHLSGSIVKK